MFWKNRYVCHCFFMWVEMSNFVRRKERKQAMADNYVEKQYAAYLQKKAAKEEAKRRAWRKQLKAYQEKLRKVAQEPQPEGQD